MNKPNLLVILGSIREQRSGDKVARWFMQAVQQNTNANLELLDLKDYPLPLYADAVSASHRQGPHANPDVQRWLDKVSAADGYIVITPEYNHSYSSVLKNAMDYAYHEWTNKAVGLVSYGGASGGLRAAEHLRQVVGELHMYDVRDQVAIQFVWEAFDEAGNLKLHAENQAKLANIVVDDVARLTQKLRG